MKKTRLLYTGACAALCVSVAVSLATGKYPVDFITLKRLVPVLLGLDKADGLLAQPAIVIGSVRLPRILMAVVTGAALSTAGVMLQGVFKNPLVSPTIIGVTSGANFGAAVALLFGSSVVVLEASAFFAGLAAVAIAYRIGKSSEHSVTSLVLAGFIVSALFKAGLSYIKCKADPMGQLPAIVFWTMGNFNGTCWSDIAAGGGLIGAGLLMSFLLRNGLNPMALGDEDAMSLGVDVPGRRAAYILLATLMVAATTATCGDIGWVGLIIPHAARMTVGADHDILVPVSAIFGGIFMLGMDTLARTLPGGEVPVGILTAMVGAPCFGYLLVRNRKNAWSE